MFSSAVNLAVAALAIHAGAATQSQPSTPSRLSVQDQAVWRDIEPSIAVLISGGRSIGAAALIDNSGLFLANRNAIPGNVVDGRLSNGKTIRLHLKSEDKLTQLALLEAENYEAEGRTPLNAPLGAGTPGSAFAILGNGPARVELVFVNRIGIVGVKRRMVPLTEARFEGNPGQYGTALFVQGRQVQGAMVSVLEQMERSAFRAQGGLGNTLQNNYGPLPQTVAYVTGPDVVRRVMEGFLSPTHEVEHPYLGVICRDAIGGGAQVVKVSADSSAEKAGIKPDDIILSLGNTTIQDQIDFAQVMFRQQVGSKLKVYIKRNNYFVATTALVGKAED